MANQCDVCGNQMVQITNCQKICPNCGFRKDCSDD